VWTKLELGDGLKNGRLYACATVNEDGLVAVQVLNTTKEVMRYKLQVEGRFAEVVMPGNSIQTLRFQM
jgi:hypothetical protein